MHILLDMHMHAMHFQAMKLSDFLSERKLTDEAFASMVGMSQSQVSRLRREVSRPSWETLAMIERATDGLVGANDFIPTRPAPKHEGAGA